MRPVQLKGDDSSAAAAGAAATARADVLRPQRKRALLVDYLADLGQRLLQAATGLPPRWGEGETVLRRATWRGQQRNVTAADRPGHLALVNARPTHVASSPGHHSLQVPNKLVQKLHEQLLLLGGPVRRRVGPGVGLYLELRRALQLNKDNDLVAVRQA